MKLQDKLKEIQDQYLVLKVIDFKDWHSQPHYVRTGWLHQQLTELYKPEYHNKERIVFILKHQELSVALLTELQKTLNNIDISNFFVIVLTDNADAVTESLNWISKNISIDPIPIKLESYTSDEAPAVKYNYNSSNPNKINVSDLLSKEKFLLTESKTFCMYPWVHIHAYPTGDAYPCCMSEMQHKIGSCKTHSLKELWNNDEMKTIRRNMLDNVENPACVRCYEQEDAGFFSGRQSANKHHGHNINKINQTKEDGTLESFQLSYWDIRFSNLCNLRCRSCGHIFSSQWYQDQTKLAGPEWAKNNRVLNYAGRYETDVWEQLVEHIDYVEQIYFAGGEPLMMEEHYRILEELERRGRFDVRLVYNTNFTHTRLKDRSVFDYWKKFDSVSVGASLDDMGPRAEYIRKGTTWAEVENNRRQMLAICPQVDFYISPTLSIFNALHLPDFHRNWVEQGLIKPQDLNVNVLQDPKHYRIDMAPPAYKKQIQDKIEQHLEWLRPLDHLGRATVGFESAINFMNAIDNQYLIPKFWAVTNKLDEIRNEKLLDIIPELSVLK